METDQVIYNRWLDMVALPKDFPKLQTLSDSELEFKAYERSDKVLEVCASLEKERLVHVFFDSGGGCTTVLRLVIRNLKRQFGRLAIAPIGVKDLIARGMLDKQQDLVTFVADQIKRKIVATLTGSEWQLRSMAPPFYDLLNFEERGKDFQTYAKELNSFAANEAYPWEKLKDMVPFFKDNELRTIIDVLDQKSVRITTVALLDFSGLADETMELYTRFISGYKTFTERGGAMQSGFHEGFFIPSRLSAEFATFPGTPHPIYWENYTPGEIFAILRYQYSERAVFRDPFGNYIEKPTYPLSEPLVPAEFVTLAYLKAKKEKGRSPSLYETVRQLELEMRGSLRRKLLYGLKLTPEMLSELSALEKEDQVPE